MPKVKIHRYPSWVSGFPGFKIELDGKFIPGKLTIFRPDLDLDLSRGDHVFVFHQWPGRGEPLNINLQRDTGILAWTTADQGPHLFLKKNRTQWVFARETTTKEVAEARKLGAKVGSRPTAMTITAVILWALALGNWIAGLSVSSVAVGVVFAASLTILCILRWRVWLSKSPRRERYEAPVDMEAHES